MSDVFGVNVRHVIITPTCRQNKTDMGAFNEAVEHVRQEYLNCLGSRGEDGAHYHLVLAVESK